MKEKILILGGSGTVGSAIYRWLARKDAFDVYGTYFSSDVRENEHMVHFAVDGPERITERLEEIKPDVVISALRGGAEKQLTLHRLVAEYLVRNHGRMIYFSTANVFDDSLESPHYEGDTCKAESDYGKFKIACENEIRSEMEDRAVIIRIPFVWGRNSPRMAEVRNGCKAGSLEIYDGLMNNNVADMQIAEYVEWIIREEKGGIFHVGTTDVIEYADFIYRLIKESGEKQPKFILSKSPGIMAVLSKRADVPPRLKWDTEKLIAYLCGKGDSMGKAGECRGCT